MFTQNRRGRLFEGKTISSQAGLNTVSGLLTRLSMSVHDFVTKYTNLLSQTNKQQVATSLRPRNG